MCVGGGGGGVGGGGSEAYEPCKLHCWHMKCLKSNRASDFRFLYVFFYSKSNLYRFYYSRGPEN